MNETMNHKLQYELQTDADSTLNVSVYDAREDVTAEEASDAMDAMIAENVFCDDDGNLAVVATSCTMVTTTNKRLF